MEYASVYIHWYQMLKKVSKEKGQIPAEQIPELKKRLEELTLEVDEEIYEKLKISEDLINELLAQFENDM